MFFFFFFHIFKIPNIGRCRNSTCVHASLCSSNSYPHSDQCNVRRGLEMFVSRAAVRSHDRGCGQTVLIGIDGGCEVDKDVIPAVLEFVLSDIIDRKTGHESEKPNLVLLSVDRAPRDFDGLVRRCSIPPSNVIDGFSEWCSLKRKSDAHSGTKERKQRSVQIGIHPLSSEQKGSVAGEILAALEASIQRSSRHIIVVIDSLTSIFRLWPGIHSFLDLRDILYEAARRKGSDCSVTVLSTIRSDDRHAPFLTPLRRVVDTFAVLSQGRRMKGENKSLVVDITDNSRDIVTMKIYKRKMSGRVQLDEVNGRMRWDNQTLTQVEIKNSGHTDFAVLSSKEEEERRQEQTLAKLGLSFRVSLSTKEKEVRAAAGLPYLHRDEDLADSALQLHPEALQVGLGSQRDHGDGDIDAAGDGSDSEEELFSEDV